MVGKTISHYRLSEKLVQGRMGAVYETQDTKLETMVALKFLSKHRLCEEEAGVRFVREAKAASALDHPRSPSLMNQMMWKANAQSTRSMSKENP